MPLCDSGSCVGGMRSTFRGRSLLDFLERWQRSAAMAVRVRLLAAVAEPTRCAVRCALRRWAVAACTHVTSESRALRRRSAMRRAVQHAQWCGWHRWCVHLCRKTARYEAVALADTLADAHAAATGARRACRKWRRASTRCFELLDAAAAVHERESCARCAASLSRWLAWWRRRASWRQRAERRASAAGGVLRLHWPGMRRFDARAIFVEEGSAGLANAYRRRRVAAVVLCRWWAVSCTPPWP